MEPFSKLFAYNAWANARIFDAAEALEEARLQEPLPGIYGSVAATARHLVEVEHGYLAMIAATEWDPLAEMDLAHLYETLTNIDERFVALCNKLAPADIERTFLIPWFKREVSVPDGLLQVLTHSTEHRADLASVITRLEGRLHRSITLCSRWVQVAARRRGSGNPRARPQRSIR